MKKLSLLLLALVMSAVTVMAQRTVSGTVTDGNNEALIGANVLVKGTTVGTITDVDGSYSLVVPDGYDQLTVSYTGYISQDLTLGVSNVMDIVLAEGVLLEEAVVTGFALDRNSRNVTYANQTVKSEDLLSQPNKNALEALRGKAAGVKITTGSGSVGASSRIVLRGEGSLTGNNNALIVIDGIAIDNTATRGGAAENATTGSAAQDGYSDFGNRFNDLNPNDIESVTVLKGPAATALYGSRGASGVLVITTKKGTEGKMKVGLNSTYSRQKAYVVLERQDKFGQGYDNSHFDSGENWSWGPAFDGVSRPWTTPVDTDGDGALEALVRPFSAVDKQIENFFNIGETYDNSVYLSGSEGGFSYYASYSNVNQQGILDNTDYQRNTINLKATAQLSDRLSTSFGVNFSNTRLNTAQEGYRPFEGQNAYANAIQAPVNIPYQELRDYNSPFHNLEGFYGSYSTNPYFILNEYVNEGDFNNFLGSVQLKYDLFDNFNITTVMGLNTINRTIETAIPSYTSPTQLVWVDDLALTTRNTRNNSPGLYTKENGRNANFDATVMGNYDTKLSNDISLNVSGGWNLFNRKTQRVTGETVGGLVVPGWYNFANSSSAALSTQNTTNYRLYGILGNASLGWKDQLFLEYSARNDWSSTLPEENNSFFYSGLGVSAIVSEMLNMDGNGSISFLKLRGGYGTTGKDAGLYLLQSTYVGNPIIQSLNNHDITTPLNGQPGFTVSDIIGNPDLKPELTTLYEAGVDVGFFDSRINLEYTYYNSVHSDQIIEVDLPSSSGFRRTSANIGEMVNKGHEVALNLRPIQGVVEGLTWDLDLIYSKNENEVTKITDDQDELIIGGPFTNASVSLVAKEGLPFGTFKSTVPRMTDDGRMIISANGFPELTAEDEYLGAYQPDFTASIGTRVGYKGLTLNVLFDIRQGGEFLSITKDNTEFNGTALSTLLGDREAIILPGVREEMDADGNIILVDNDVEVTAQELYAVSGTSFGGNSLLIDASFVKLRELGLSYEIPKSVLSSLPIGSATLSVFGANLKFWLPDENTYADPEIGGPNLSGNAVGVETSQTPTTKNYGVRLGLTF